MTRTVVIDPVTRIEGHAKISLYLGDDGKVEDARFHVVEFRGFEKFCVGRTFWEMPGITARVCGICPVSHILASAKAGDDVLGIRIPPRAEKLRRLMNWGQLVQSHALSFFHLSAPDLLLGMDSDPAQRNIMGLIQAAAQHRAQRHPPAPVRPGGDPPAGRAQRASGLGRARRRARAADAPRRAARSSACCPRPSTSPSWRWTCSRTATISSTARSSTTATSPACSWAW